MTTKSVRPIGIDLFAGAGGLSLGFEQAGFDVAAAVEIDPVHAAVHAYNFPNCEVIPRSVTDLTGAQIRQLAQIGKREVDVVFGGAPCQGFSLIGKRAFDDPRNSLVRDFVRIVRELDANYFVFENVKGLTLGKHRQFLEELITEFAAAGYATVKEWKVLNAAEYGVPQDRQRLFLLGAKRGLPLPEYPARVTHKSGAKNPSISVGPNCGDALGDLPDAESFSSLLHVDSVRTTRWGVPSEYAASMRCLNDEHWKFGYQRVWEQDVLTSSLRSNHTPLSRERFRNTPPGEVEPVSRFLKLSPVGVANTLRAGTDSARGAFTSPRPIHYKWDRCVTVREMARLHGFPDWFRFHVTKWHGARQIGNSVPPPLAAQVAAEVLRAIGTVPKKPRQKLELGDPALLSLGMEEASTYWSVPRPIGQRDRKNHVLVESGD